MFDLSKATSLRTFHTFLLSAINWYRQAKTKCLLTLVDSQCSSIRWLLLVQGVVSTPCVYVPSCQVIHFYSLHSTNALIAALATPSMSFTRCQRPTFFIVITSIWNALLQRNTTISSEDIFFLRPPLLPRSIMRYRPECLRTKGRLPFAAAKHANAYLVSDYWGATLT